MQDNPFSLEGKTILITGASSGIGRQTAILCSRMKATVILQGRNEDRLTKTHTLLDGKGHIVCQGDLKYDVNRIVENIPALDGIVHAAGTIATIPFQYLDPSVLREIFEVNFFSPFLLTQTLFKNKKLKSGCSVVFLSSLAGNVIASYGNIAYGASKSAMNGMVKVLSLELSRKKIRVNTIMPGMVKTEMIQDFLQKLTPEQLTEDEKKYPLGYGEPEDVANAALFFLSDASRWSTGSSLILDGGFSLQ